MSHENKVTDKITDNGFEIPSDKSETWASHGSGAPGPHCMFEILGHLDSPNETPKSSSMEVTGPILL